MRADRPLAILAGLAVLTASALVVGGLLAALNLVTEPAALATGLVCLIAVAAGVRAGLRGGGPETPYW